MTEFLPAHGVEQVLDPGRGGKGVWSEISLKPLSDGVTDRSIGLAVEGIRGGGGHDKINLRFQKFDDALSSHGGAIGCFCDNQSHGLMVKI